MEKKTKVIVALVVMAVIVGAVIYFYMKKKKTDALKVEGSPSGAPDKPITGISKAVGKKLDKSKIVSVKSMGKPADAIFLSNE